MHAYQMSNRTVSPLPGDTVEPHQWRNILRFLLFAGSLPDPGFCFRNCGNLSGNSGKVGIKLTLVVLRSVPSLPFPMLSSLSAPLLAASMLTTAERRKKLPATRRAPSSPLSSASLLFLTLNRRTWEKTQ